MAPHPSHRFCSRPRQRGHPFFDTSMSDPNISAIFTTACPTVLTHPLCLEIDRSITFYIPRIFSNRAWPANLSGLKFFELAHYETVVFCVAWWFCHKLCILPENQISNCLDSRRRHIPLHHFRIHKITLKTCGCQSAHFVSWKISFKRKYGPSVIRIE